MKEIPLTQGKVALVDDEDYELLSKYKWCAKKLSNTYYAENKKLKSMHRFILNVIDPNVEVDHKDHNGLNNTRNNLRICENTSQNRYNAIKRVKKCISIYKGVSFWQNNWRAYIQLSGKTKHLGKFNTEEDAALFYNKIAYAAWGKFAYLNEIKITDVITII